MEIRYYAIIYDLLDDMKGVLSGLLSPIQRETWLGNATLLQVFDISKVGKIAGCRITDGVVRRGARTRVIRNDIVIQENGVLSDAAPLQGRRGGGGQRRGVRHRLRQPAGPEGRRP